MFHSTVLIHLVELIFFFKKKKYRIEDSKPQYFEWILLHLNDFIYIWAMAHRSLSIGFALRINKWVCSSGHELFWSSFVVLHCTKCKQIANDYVKRLYWANLKLVFYCFMGIGWGSIGKIKGIISLRQKMRKLSHKRGDNTSIYLQVWRQKARQPTWRQAICHLQCQNFTCYAESTGCY